MIDVASHFSRQVIISNSYQNAAAHRLLFNVLAGKGWKPAYTRGFWFRPGDNAMYHTIEFVEELTVDLEISSKRPLERLVIRRGTRQRTQIKPYVIETKHGLVEVADLFFADGTTARMVPFKSFRFVD